MYNSITLDIYFSFFLSLFLFPFTFLSILLLLISSRHIPIVIIVRPQFSIIVDDLPTLKSLCGILNSEVLIELVNH